MPKRLCVSFSLGETSAYMTHRLLTAPEFAGWEKVVVTANTGEEWEQSLQFGQRCAEHFGFDWHLIETVIRPGKRQGPGAWRVTFETASRHGEPFEKAIRKYGIPNQAFKHCTRVLKTQPIVAYLSQWLGWQRGTYKMAIGIRADEADRVSSSAEEHGLIYPLVNLWPTTKPQVNTFWRSQPFRLGLRGYQGNCKWCWKKSFRKHFTIIHETPEVYNFPARMEAEYGHIGPEFERHNPPPEYRRTFFRGNRSTSDLFREYAEKWGTFSPAEDDAQVFDEDLDVGSGCEESCEVFADEDGEVRDAD